MGSSEDGGKARRLFELDDLLRQKPYRVSELVEQLRVDRRYVQRDLETLRGLDRGLRDTPGKRHHYDIPSPRQSLDLMGTLVLYSATRLIYHRAGGHVQHYHRALNVLRKWLPESIQPVLERSLTDVGKRRSTETMALEKVAEAWFGLHPLRFEYRAGSGSGQWRTNVLEAYFLEVHPVNLGLYAVGKETSFHNKLRTFKLSRMRRFTVLHDESYAIPNDFDPRAFFESAWGVVGKSDGETVAVRLRFAPEAARRLEEGGYPNMEMKPPHHDGFREVTVRAGVDRTGLPLEVLVWVRSWGPLVEVLEPEALREKWLEDCRELLRRYTHER